MLKQDPFNISIINTLVRITQCWDPFDNSIITLIVYRTQLNTPDIHWKYITLFDTSTCRFTVYPYYIGLSLKTFVQTCFSVSDHYFSICVFFIIQILLSVISLRFGHSGHWYIHTLKIIHTFVTIYYTCT